MRRHSREPPQQPEYGGAGLKGDCPCGVLSKPHQVIRNPQEDPHRKLGCGRKRLLHKPHERSAPFPVDPVYIKAYGWLAHELFTHQEETQRCEQQYLHCPHYVLSCVGNIVNRKGKDVIEYCRIYAYKDVQKSCKAHRKQHIYRGFFCLDPGIFSKEGEIRKPERHQEESACRGKREKKPHRR